MPFIIPFTAWSLCTRRIYLSRKFIVFLGRREIPSNWLRQTQLNTVNQANVWYSVTSMAVEPDFCAHDDNLTKFAQNNGSNRVDCATPRKNSDMSPVDNNGRHLLDLCIGSGVRILNSRVFGDSLGCHTCFSHNGNLSTIDYFLASKGILDRAKYLQVFNPSIHSIHCYIKLSISTKSLLNRQSSDKYKGMVAAVNINGTIMSPTSSKIRMMTSSNGNIFRVTGHLCGEFTGPRWILRTKASDTELWCFLWSAIE